MMASRLFYIISRFTSFYSTISFRKHITRLSTRDWESLLRPRASQACTADAEGGRGGEITKSRHARASFICVSPAIRMKNGNRPFSERVYRASPCQLLHDYSISLFSAASSRSLSSRSSASRALRVRFGAQHPLSVLMQASQQRGIHSARLSLNTNAPRVRFNPLFDSTIQLVN